jgi:hypothetical protein
VSSGWADDARCAAEYRLLRQEFLDRGLDLDAIETSRRELTVHDGDSWILEVSAYAPTGVALGVPLPEPAASAIWRVAKSLNRHVGRLVEAGDPLFALVPRPYHHITVVNRSHFEVTTSRFLSEEEHQVAEKVLRKLATEPVAIKLHGLILTSRGRLVVPGSPVGRIFYELRRGLVEALPQLGVHVPMTAHVKLGHLVAKVEGAQLDALRSWVTEWDRRLSSTAVFADVYTPVDRIPLTKAESPAGEGGDQADFVLGAEP